MRLVKACFGAIAVANGRQHMHEGPMLRLVSGAAFLLSAYSTTVAAADEVQINEHTLCRATRCARTFWNGIKFRRGKLSDSCRRFVLAAVDTFEVCHDTLAICLTDRRTDLTKTGHEDGGRTRKHWRKWHELGTLSPVNTVS
jgi:hypothetical protein